MTIIHMDIRLLHNYSIRQDSIAYCLNLNDFAPRCSQTNGHTQYLGPRELMAGILYIH